LQRVVLCGHSYGGVVIGAVADRIPEHITSLVYLDAAVPESGKSFLELIVGPEQIAQFVAATADQGGGMLPPFPAAALDVNPADRAMVDELCTPHPFATLAERLTLSGAHAGIARKTYVFATRWQASLYRTTHAARGRSSMDRARNRLRPRRHAGCAAAPVRDPDGGDVIGRGRKPA
jgi:pimeloyl-ACP methyl ester carboxylesterase